MGRTIPSFRISTLMEENGWKLYRKYLNKREKKIFNNMFLFAYIYNSASSYASNQVIIIPIIVSIALHHHIKISLFKKGTTIFFFQSSILSKDMKDKHILPIFSHIVILLLRKLSHGKVMEIV